MNRIKKVIILIITMFIATLSSCINSHQIPSKDDEEIDFFAACQKISLGMSQSQVEEIVGKHDTDSSGGDQIEWGYVRNEASFKYSKTTLLVVFKKNKVIVFSFHNGFEMKSESIVY